MGKNDKTEIKEAVEQTNVDVEKKVESKTEDLEEVKPKPKKRGRPKKVKTESESLEDKATTKEKATSTKKEKKNTEKTEKTEKATSKKAKPTKEKPKKNTAKVDEKPLDSTDGQEKKKEKNVKTKKEDDSPKKQSPAKDVQEKEESKTIHTEQCIELTDNPNFTKECEDIKAEMDALLPNSNKNTESKSKIKEKSEREVFPDKKETEKFNPEEVDTYKMDYDLDYKKSLEDDKDYVSLILDLKMQLPNTMRTLRKIDNVGNFFMGIMFGIMIFTAAQQEWLALGISGLIGVVLYFGTHVVMHQQIKEQYREKILKSFKMHPLRKINVTNKNITINDETTIDWDEIALSAYMTKNDIILLYVKEAENILLFDTTEMKEMDKLFFQEILEEKMFDFILQE